MAQFVQLAAPMVQYWNEMLVYDVFFAVPFVNFHAKNKITLKGAGDSGFQSKSVSVKS